MLLANSFRDNDMGFPPLRKTDGTAAAQGDDMTREPMISVIIPAFNEQDRLEPTLRSIVGYLRSRGVAREVIVVDDGSRDGTSDLAARLSSEFPEVRMIRLARNSGKGCAVRTGVLNAMGTEVLFADADGATPIEEIERLEAALAAGADVAIGSRALYARGVEVRTRFYRKVMGRIFHSLVSMLTVRGIQDTQCGFKLLKAGIAHDLFCRMRMDGFSFDVEVLLMAQRCGYKVAEIPVNWTHQPGSRVNLVTDSLRMAVDLFRIRAHAMRGHYDQPHVALLQRYSPSAPSRSRVCV
jgi:dolichyl-phosphate beta-glucosyltransferase